MILRPSTLRAGLALIALLLLTACSSLPVDAPAAPGSLAATVDLRGVRITVGSKNYSEARVLGALYVNALRAAGATVVDRTGIGGTMLAYNALITGQIDVYSEYTGTAWATILGQSEIIGDANLLFDKVSAASRPAGLTWFAMAPANSNYAIAGPEKTLRQRGINTVSDYAALVRSDPTAARLCASNEFATRDDGLPGIEARYRFRLPPPQLLVQEQSISVATITTHHQCEFTVVTSVDPRLAGYHLRLLTDGQHAFPTYNPALVMHTDTYLRHRAEYDRLLGAISRLITQDALIELNRRTQVDNQPESRVAQDFLRAHHIS